VEFDLGYMLGRFVIDKDSMQVFDDSGETGVTIHIDQDREGVAAVLLAAAQHLLAGCSDEVSKRVLLEGGLLESNALRASNDLKALKPEVKLEANVKQHKTLLTEKTEQILSEGGIKPDVIRFFSALSWSSTVLNNSKNPVKAAGTLMAKPHFPAMFEDWLKKHPLPVPQKNKPTPIPPPPPEEQDEREGDYDCACADPKPDTNGDSLELYGASCTRCGGFVVRPKVFQIEEN